jgi:hypothetical protein
LKKIKELIRIRNQAHNLTGATKKLQIPPRPFAVSHQSLTWGTTLRSEKVIFSLSKKLWNKKYPSSRFNHLSTTSASISPSNNGISKFTYTLKGVAWPLDEDASLMGNHRRIYAKLSIILFLCRVRDSSSNILIGSRTPSSFFSSPMGCC